ncbi:MAG: hypothetical protein FJ128_10565 [Deltaproteobacteria bacterium]|nr:hypothetical protein [Deltaproteobacteria bacterium]
MILSDIFGSLWRRLKARWPWRRPGASVWGDEPPVILGTCRQCGAVVLQGWHRETAEGLLCRRCASSRDRSG